jgi:hypothetical protein
MEVYILDSLLRRNAVYDQFESFIWTERWQEIGDFELDLLSNLDVRSQFVVGAKLATNSSMRVMEVKSVEDVTDSEGKAVLKVKGVSLEHILEDRAARHTLSDLETAPKWIIIDTPGEVARTMFDDICRTPSLYAADAIPFLQPGSIYPADTIPESLTPIRWEQDPASLLSAIKEVCSLYDLGFRLVRNFDTSQLYFDIYSGIDRTTRQGDFPPVVFSPNMDNLQNTTEFSSIEEAKNVAYVFSNIGSAEVFADGVDPLEAIGFDRHVLYVDASEITLEHPDPSGAMIQKGKEELARHRAKSIFDGELNPYGDYTYGVDYEMGDLVEMRNKDGIITYKRVTEQIFVTDAEGERSYPTLSMDLFASANTWMSWHNKTTPWADMTVETWADME